MHLSTICRLEFLVVFVCAVDCFSGYICAMLSMEKEARNQVRFRLPGEGIHVYDTNEFSAVRN